MIIYLHETDFRGGIKTKKIEAEEKGKTYKLKLGQNYYGRVLKADIGQPFGGAWKRMYTLTPDNTPFIKSLIEDNERKIENLKRGLENSVARKTELLKLLDEKKEGETK